LPSCFDLFDNRSIDGKAVFSEPGKRRARYCTAFASQFAGEAVAVEKVVAIAPYPARLFCEVLVAGAESLDESSAWEKPFGDALENSFD
jgi:hypothetical protein